MGKWIACQLCSGSGQLKEQKEATLNEISTPCNQCHGLGSIYTVDENEHEEFEFVYDED